MTGDLDPAQAVAAHIADHLAALGERISAAHTPGNLDGLFAHHVLRHVDGTASILDTDGGAEHLTDEHDDGPVGAPRLAALGYHLDYLDEEAAPAVKAAVVAGMSQLMRRDPFPLDGVTFLHDPRQLLGIALAVIAISDEVPDAGRWLRKIIDDSRFPATTILHELIRRHIRSLLTREPSVWAANTGLRQPADLAILH